MIKIPEKTIKYINSCIRCNTVFDDKYFISTVCSEIKEYDHKVDILSFPRFNLLKLNKLIYNYFYDLKENVKNDKYLDQFQGTLNFTEMNNAFYNNVKMVNSLISLGNHKKRNLQAINLYKLKNIYGVDKSGIWEDIFQEGRLYLWEAIRKFDNTRTEIKIDTFANRLVIKKLLSLDRNCRSDKNDGDMLYINDYDMLSNLIKIDYFQNDIKYIYLSKARFESTFLNYPNILNSLQKKCNHYTYSQIELPLYEMIDIIENS